MKDDLDLPMDNRGILRQFFGGYPESELQMAALNKYASQHQIKAESPEKVDRELLYDALGMLIETSTEIEERGVE